MEIDVNRVVHAVNPWPLYHVIGMIKTLPAVYENGVLRPLVPLALKEHQQVTVTISESENASDEWLDQDYLAAVDALAEPEPTLDEVRRGLSNIPGKLSDAVRAERDARG